ncbi:hypothetical protein CK503_11135 [Aliifodinibius salipaludis]|uniref:HTH cro/C1-type domain-containing protein n=1 Tax=Fodinibius salipaludis TaxID=2032627 RepID=A0A2A2GA17_9BACT|nr:hypothetical protein [Aliifodinibius salipaludis]PAU93697.1 hypothetical protein CK503_11135 [Aliifodinibius salipaludis]
MHQSPIQLFKKYLRKKDISPQEFSQISGMPETEVHGIMEGDLPITNLRAHHLAVTFDTDVEVWFKDNEQKIKEDGVNQSPKQPSLVGSD